MNKGQIAFTDLFIALFIATILIFATMSTWDIYKKRLVERTSYDDILTYGFQITDTLVKSPGKPGNWNETNVEVIGLSNNNLNVSSEKLNNLLKLDYNNAKYIFNIERYDFYFEITDINNNNLTVPFGLIPTGEDIVKLNRYIIYENEEAILQFTLWK